MIVDGKMLAELRIQELSKERSAYGALSLSIVVMQEDAVTSSFLKIKRRVAERLHVTVDYVPKLEDARGDGVIVQLPLPTGVSVDAVRNAIPLMKDVDGLSDAAFDAFSRGEFPPPPVARAIAFVLTHHQVPVRGRQVAVLGQGRLVGRPAAELMRQMGAEVTVLERGASLEALHTADIVILGAGAPGLVKPEMVKDGVVILDAGTSEAAGKVVGDADSECVHKASLMTPVPGGIGPIAVAEIFANLFHLAGKRGMAG